MVHCLSWGTERLTSRQKAHLNQCLHGCCLLYPHSWDLLHIALWYASCRLCSGRGRADALASGRGA